MFGLCGVVDALAAELPALIPQPESVHWQGGQLPLRAGLRIDLAPGASAGVADAAGLLEHELHDQAGLIATIQGGGAARDGDVVLRLEPGDAGLANREAYSLSVSNRIEIAASDPAGLRWGVQTLLQCIEQGPSGPFVPRGLIQDRPAYPWRELLLDPARVYLDPQFLRRTIDVMSAYKLNVLHLHLTDDQGWRFETKAFPRCNPPDGLYYTQAELKALVAYAARRGIDIVPEFDFPGHARAAVAAYPELSCDGRVPRAAGEAILCPGKPFTWTFIEGIAAEAAQVFPSRYLDLGGDEPFAITQWTKSPDCLRRMKEKGVTTLQSFYHTFLIDLDAIARRHGRTLIIWNDAVHPGVEPMPPRDIVIDAWTDYGNARALSRDGYTIINSSNLPLYLSSLGWGEGFPLRQVLRWTPTQFGLRDRMERGAVTYRPLAAGSTIIGGQASVWATEQALIDRRLYPRLLAVADTLWSGGRGAGDFEQRFNRAQANRLVRLGVTDTGDAGSRALLTDRERDALATAGWVKTAATYRDFELQFEEHIPLGARTTGVFVSGASIGLLPPPGWAPTRALRTLREWHRMDIVARAKVVSLTIDGILAWSVADPAPRAGPIEIRPEGPGFEYRDLTIKLS